MSDSDKADQKNESPTADKTTDTESLGAEAKSAQPNSNKETPKHANSPRPSPAAPRIWPSMLVLTLFSSALGAGIATYYWTSLAGNTRLTQLETRLAEIDATSGAQENLRGDLAVIDARLGQMESRVTDLENAPATPAAMLQQPNDFDPRMTQLAERLNAIENAVPVDLAQRLDGFARSDTQAALAARVSELEQSNGGETLLRAGRILALSDLSRAAQGSEPFPIALEAATAALPGEAVIGALRPQATTGAPTREQLRARFPAAARQALAAERSSGAENIFARMWNRITSLVAIRRVGNVEGDDSGARLARAEAALDREDLAAAAGEVATMEGPASQSISPWLEDARARLAIENAVAGINARIVQMLADQTAPANAP